MTLRHTKGKKERPCDKIGPKSVINTKSRSRSLATRGCAPASDTSTWLTLPGQISWKTTPAARSRFTVSCPQQTRINGNMKVYFPERPGPRVPLFLTCNCGWLLFSILEVPQEFGEKLNTASCVPPQRCMCLCCGKHLRLARRRAGEKLHCELRCCFLLLHSGSINTDSGNIRKYHTRVHFPKRLPPNS